MKNLDRLNSVFFMILSVVICLASWEFQFSELPAYMVFPFLLGLCLLVLSAVLLVQNRASFPSRPSALSPKREGREAIFFLVAFFLCLLLFEPLGFIVSTFLLVFILMKAIARKTKAQSLLYGLLISLSTYLLFAVLLGVRLPAGILKFL